MHLRDLGVKGLEAHRGGFSKSAHGVMSMMVIVTEPKEPIPNCETEAELQEHLDELEAERHAIKAATGAVIDTSATPLWPVIAPQQVLLTVAATPRSGTPRDLKRTCRKDTPTSFDIRTPTGVLGDVETDGWLVALGGALTGVERGAHGVIFSDQIPQMDGEFELSLRASSDNLMDNIELFSGPWEHNPTNIEEALTLELPTQAVHRLDEDTQLKEVEKAMSSLLSPHALPLSIAEDMEIDIFTPQSCRSRRPETEQCCAPRRGTTPRSCWASPRSARSSVRREYIMDVVELNDDGSMVPVV